MVTGETGAHSVCIPTPAVSPQSSDLLPSLHGKALRQRDFHPCWGPYDPCLSGRPGLIPPAETYSAIWGAVDPSLWPGRGEGTPLPARECQRPPAWNSQRFLCRNGFPLRLVDVAYRMCTGLFQFMNYECGLNLLWEELFSLNADGRVLMSAVIGVLSII